MGTEIEISLISGLQLGFGLLFKERMKNDTFIKLIENIIYITL